MPHGGTCTTLEELRTLIEEVSYPLVIKPLDANHGNGVCINITDGAAAELAFHHAKTFSDTIIVETYIKGEDFRLLVINGKLSAAAHRLPGHVTGDGRSTVTELVEEVNRHPDRGNGHEALLTKITLDSDSDRLLAMQSLSTDSIPAEGQRVMLKSTANLSTGGTATDVTDEIHPENRFMAERIAATIGLDICGIDVIAPDISTPLSENGGAVIEVNAAPGFRMHLSPSNGTPRNPAREVVDMLIPPGTESRIPIFSVTGTNGKTTTTRLLAHLTQQCGYTTGYTTTDGVYINQHQINSGDCSGPSSASLLLRDPMVEFAVLETARGGLLRAGLAFDQCDVGIVTNVQEDHLGLCDIHTLEELAEVKATVPRTVKPTGYAVLNAEDPHCVKMAGELNCQVAYFSMEHDHPVLLEHLELGGIAAYIKDGLVILERNKVQTELAKVADIPLTMNGSAVFMTANILAAAAAAFAYGFSPEQIRQSFMSFRPCLETTPGRMNLHEFGNFSVLVDYAHNPHGMRAIQQYLSHIIAKRKIGIISGVGDRRDDDIAEMARLGAEMFDYLIIRQEHDLRGRTLEEMHRLMTTVLAETHPELKYTLIPDEAEAIKHAMDMAGCGDFIVALCDDYRHVTDIIESYRKSKTTISTEETLDYLN